MIGIHNRAENDDLISHPHCQAVIISSLRDVVVVDVDGVNKWSLIASFIRVGVIIGDLHGTLSALVGN